MNMKVIGGKNYQELSTAAAKLLIQKLKETISQKGKAVLALSGGRSVAGFLKSLNEEDLKWNKVDIFLIDERVVPLDDKESNYKSIKENLLTKMKPKIHPFDLNKGLQEYNQQFQKAGAHFDLVVLGVGEDGHIASLFPHHKALTEKDKRYIEINGAPKLPPKRITASPEMIKDADTVILLFVSEAKKKAYENFRNEKIFPQECPAKIALGTKEVYVLKDF